MERGSDDMVRGLGELELSPPVIGAHASVGHLPGIGFGALHPSGTDPMVLDSSSFGSLRLLCKQLFSATGCPRCRAPILRVFTFLAGFSGQARWRFRKENCIAARMSWWAPFDASEADRVRVEAAMGLLLGRRP